MNYRQCHFVFLDGDRITGRQWFGDEIGADQLEWLEKDLAANRGRTTFVFTHHPIESSQQGKGIHRLENRSVRLRSISIRNSCFDCGSGRRMRRAVST